MANEKNGTAAVTEIVNGNLVVVREPIKGKDGKQMKTQDGRDYFAYIVRGNVRGRDIKVDFCPKDKGGYEPLDIVFDVAPKAELLMEEKEMENDNGKVTKYMAYTVRTIDENGEIWECGVKPARDSDKSLLKMLLNVLNATAKKTA